jgi:nucleotide-binding universal stress UspA family protein
MGRIAVGIDGSDQSVNALRWAIAAAHVRHDDIDVIYAWQLPVPAMSFEGVMPPPNIDYRAEAEEVVAHAIKAATDGADAPVRITAHTPNAPASKALIDASASSDLLVVASRGRGGFSSLLLGSVSQQCAHHAKCPVVIFHGRD